MPQTAQHPDFTQGCLAHHLIICRSHSLSYYLPYSYGMSIVLRQMGPLQACIFSPSLSLNFLTATTPPVSLLRHLSTTPYAPSPTTSMTSYLFILSQHRTTARPLSDSCERLPWSQRGMAAAGLTAHGALQQGVQIQAFKASAQQ